MPTQKTPLTRIDETGATTGQGLIYDGDKIGWGDVATGSVAAGFQTKHTITATQTVSSNQQYQVFGTLNIADGGTITLAPSGDLVLDAPDDPNKAAGWTRNSNTNAITTDHSITVANSISAQGNVYGNARTMTNPGMIIQVVATEQAAGFTHTATTQQSTGLSATITPSSVNSKIKVTFNCKQYQAGPGDGATGSTAQVSNSIWRAVGNTHSDLHGWQCYYYWGITYQRVQPYGGAQVFLDEPSTTDTVTYYVTTGNDTGTHARGMNGPLKFILEEIAG